LRRLQFLSLAAVVDAEAPAPKAAIWSKPPVTATFFMK